MSKLFSDGYMDKMIEVINSPICKDKKEFIDKMLVALITSKQYDIIPDYPDRILRELDTLYQSRWEKIIDEFRSEEDLLKIKRKLRIEILGRVFEDCDKFQYSGLVKMILDEDFDAPSLTDREFYAISEEKYQPRIWEKINSLSEKEFDSKYLELRNGDLFPLTILDDIRDTEV